MCDTTPLKICLAAALAAVVAALAFIAIAVVTNGSIWNVEQSPGWMLLAAGSSALAVGACVLALNSLGTLCACLAPQCAGECDNLRKLIHATWVVLGIQTTAAAAAAIPALIPFLGAVPMETIVSALLVQSALLLSHIVFVAALDNCARAAVAIDPFPAVIATGPVQSGLTASPSGRKRWFWRNLWKRLWK
ncbi:MAG TPA: hypothetical protein VF620_07585 [Allosphingosinicella sp.]|jgi:hypothetical protein